ncbi:MAG TPA: hypothetical protein DDY39_16370, partial [Nitrospira sp.]|nr:hypothetical protein [Nitrospira sp.]
GTGTLLLGNGDIQCLEDISRRVRETGVDGVLVGRGVLGAPWFFRPKEWVRGQSSSERGPESGLSLSNVSLDERFAVLLEHAKQFVEIFGHKQFYRMRKHLGWYCKGFPHAASLRAQMVRVSSVEELQSILEAFNIRPQSGVVLPCDESVDMAETLASRCS